MKKLRLGDFILGAICGVVIMVGIANINNTTSAPTSNIEKSKCLILKKANDLL